MVAAGPPAVAFVRAKLAPADGARIARLLADLDDKEFRTREQASMELERLVVGAEAPLRQALARQPSAEVRRRIEALLEKMDSEGHVRVARMLQVLEQIGTAEAWQVLKEVADGPLEAFVHREARAALERRRKEP
jgi:hypothetical protein